MFEYPRSLTSNITSVYQDLIDAIDAHQTENLFRLEKLIALSKETNNTLMLSLSPQIADLGRSLVYIQSLVQEGVDMMRMDSSNGEGELSIPENHMAASHKLLQWPTVKGLISPHTYTDDYVMMLEEERGVICILEDNEKPPSEIRSPDNQITDSGLLNLDEETVRRYFKTYLCRIHNLHPFLDEHEVSVQLDSFIQSYCRQPFRLELSHTFYQENQPSHVCRTTEHARILLVLALGAICGTESRSTSLDARGKSDYRQQYIPTISELTSTSSTQPPKSKANNRAKYKNFPGLHLYAYAAEILGSCQGGPALDRIQACLLAGLYTGQLAHSFQSYGWISEASRGCQILMRWPQYERLEDNRTRDLYSFALWTALQLESDLLAEFDLPASGISRSDSRIPPPTGSFTIQLSSDANAPNTKMMSIHYAQIHLYKLLHYIYTDLYEVEKSPRQFRDKTRQLIRLSGILSESLEAWRKCLPDSIRWEDQGPHSNEINAASMRNKYYRARCLVYRPLLYHTLHLSQVNLGVPPELHRACKLYVDSAILGIQVFDGVEHRLILTDMFSTSHAQFGNALSLSAIYTSFLSELVPRATLHHLLCRTIKFLLCSEEISPTLRADARILTEIHEKLFGLSMVGS
ncbi:uncharacterized protein N7483_012382 [Penicillium malachiteum]|uniref:uncharacterized protein n=1 Tax=Penicillium malachiteum TaxID=1324776 RepID=UPI0025498BB8|nr:uncharacterized protein N7483_012382 [Penicillium malachiteum]KAJ5715201.1 hypothetical protein N7483_012382 [Penicillium malachiteum]